MTGHREVPISSIAIACFMSIDAGSFRAPIAIFVLAFMCGMCSRVWQVRILLIACVLPFVIFLLGAIDAWPYDEGELLRFEGTVCSRSETEHAVVFRIDTYEHDLAYLLRGKVGSERI
jgi:hypothetical protein